MKYKRQTLIILFYCICLVLAFSWGIGFHLDHADRIPINQIFYFTSLLIGFISSFYILNNFTFFYFEGLKKNLSNLHPTIDPSEFDLEKFEKDNFEKKQSNKVPFLFQPVILVLICTPYLYFILVNQFEFRVLSGILANLAFILYFAPISFETYILRFLFMRHLDKITNDLK